MAKDKSTQRSSATITGIPVAGAIGGGDNSDRLGRPRRYTFYRDSGGSPSMSADSNFSSRLSAVNKGYEIEGSELSMFPEQEDDTEDTYSIDDYELPFTRKLPRYSRVARRHRVKSSVREGDRKVKKISLSQALLEDQSITEYNLLPDEASDFLDTALDIGGDIAGDWGAAALGAVPVIGDAAALGLAAFNVKQINSTMESSENNILSFLSTGGSAEGREELEDDMEDLIEDVIDLVQRLLEAMPDPGASEVGSAGISILSNLSRLKFGRAGWQAWRALPASAKSAGAKLSKYTGIGKSGLGASAKTAVILEPLAKFLAFVGQTDPSEITSAGIAGSSGPAGLPGTIRDIITLGPFTSTPGRIALLAALIDDWDSQKAAAYNSGVSVEEFDSGGYYNPNISVSGSNIDQYSTGNTSGTRASFEETMTDSGQGGDTTRYFESKNTKKREEKMSEKLLRKFILEAVDLEAMKIESPYDSLSGHNAVYEPNNSYPTCPHGIKSNCSVCDEEEIDYIKDFIVQVGADKGVITSQQRLDEEILREFIREAAESQKKSKENGSDLVYFEEDDDPIDEYSAGGVGGVVTPLGTNASGKVPTKSEKASQMNFFKNTWQ